MRRRGLGGGGAATPVWTARNFMGTATRVRPRGARRRSHDARQRTANRRAQPAASPHRPRPPPRRPRAAVSIAACAPAARKLYRLEADVADVEVEGKIPSDLEGRVLSHRPRSAVSASPRATFRSMAKAMRACSASRTAACTTAAAIARNQRYLAQEKAHRLLFPMYRNIYQDDPAAKGLSRSTAEHAHHQSQAVCCSR